MAEKCGYDGCAKDAAWRIYLKLPSGPLDNVLCGEHASELLHSGPIGTTFINLAATTDFPVVRFAQEEVKAGHV